MNITGNIIAISNIIRLKSPGSSMIFKFKAQEDYIDVLVKEKDLFHIADDIIIGEIYELTNLQKCSLKMGKTEVSMLMTTQDSALEKINVNAGEKPVDTPTNYLLEEKSLIIYKGTVTKVINPDFGIYELDQNLKLYCIYLKAAADIPILNVGDNVLVERSHLIKNDKESSLLCCGLTNIKSSNNEKSDNHVAILLSNLICQLKIDYKSLGVFQHHVTVLNSKLCPSLMSYDQLLSCEKYVNRISTVNGFFMVLFNCEHLIEKSHLRAEACSSALQEFISQPHKCIVTGNSHLLSDLSFPSMEILLTEAKKEPFIPLKTWKYSWVSFGRQNKKILIGNLVSTDDGSLYLHDQTSAIPCVILKRSDANLSEGSSGSCLVLHKANAPIINRLVAFSSFELVSEKSFMMERSLPTYLVVREKDVIVLSDKVVKRAPDTADTSNRNVGEISLNICQVFVPKKKTLPVLCNEEWKNQVFIEGLAISNIVVEVSCPENLSGNQVDAMKIDLEDFSNVDPCSLPNDVELKKRNLLLTDDLLSAYSSFESGKAVLLKIPVKLCVEKNLNEEANLMARKFVNNNPLILPKDTVIEPFGCGKDICSQHSSFAPKQYSKIKLIADSCFCSLGNKYHSIEEISTRGEMFNTSDSIDIEGFIKEKWIVKNKEFKKDSDPVTLVSLVLADKENVAFTMTLYIAQNYPEWSIFGLIPGNFVRVSGVIVLKSQKTNGSYYLKSTLKFGLELIEPSSENVVNFRKSNKNEVATTPSPLKYFIHVNDNLQFRSLSTIIRILSVEIFNSAGTNLPVAKAKFVVDDGSLQVTAHCSGINVKNLLSISDRQWQDLLDLAASEPRGLNFNWWNVRKNVDKETNTRILLFRYLCSRGDIRRQVISVCRAYATSREGDQLQKGQFRVFCISIEKVQPIDVSVEFLRLLKK